MHEAAEPLPAMQRIMRQKSGHALHHAESGPRASGLAMSAGQNPGATENCGRFDADERTQQRQRENHARIRNRAAS